MIVTLEGNIGAGKSTFLSILKDAFDGDPSALSGKRVVVLTESVDEWMALKEEGGGDKSIFDMFYADPKKYAFVFQSYVLMSRIKHLLDVERANPDAIIICERGCMVDYEVFARSLRDSGTMTGMEWAVYEAWHHLVTDVFGLTRGRVQGQIYLRAAPSVCLARIGRRARKGEEALALAQIEDLHARHDMWLMHDETPDETPAGLGGVARDEARDAEMGADSGLLHVIDAGADFVADAEARRGVVAGVTAFLRGLAGLSGRRPASPEVTRT